jgi:capsular exopolysaccharide synthesis family protein
MNNDLPGETGMFSGVEQFFSGRTFFEMLVRFWRIIVVCVVFFGAAAYFITYYLIPKEYAARATLYAWNVSGAEVRGISSADLSVGSQLVNDYRRLITSKTIQNQVFERTKARFGWDEGVDAVRYSIRADFERNTRIVTISGESRSPDVAEFVTNETAEVFSALIFEIFKVNNVKIIDRADRPGAPFKPQMRNAVAVGILLGALAGLGIAMLLTLIDRSIKNPEQAESMLKRPVIGTIPMIDGKLPDFVRNIGAVYDVQESHAVESSRVIRTNLHYLLPDNNGLGRVLMVTSSVSGEGKSNCISSIAMVTAQSEKKVLIIDADLRKPSMHKLFKMERGRGLVSILTGEAEFDEVVVHDQEIEMLDILTAGPLSVNPAELLMSKRFNDLIKSLRERYDYIFIDAPPCLVVADPLVIGQLVDGVIFVLACNGAKVEVVRQAVRQVESAGIKILGLVLNKFDHKSAGYGYSYNYSYAYAYAYGGHPHKHGNGNGNNNGNGGH